jgi:ABC-2 type transport system permease protein
VTKTPTKRLHEPPAASAGAGDQVAITAASPGRMVGYVILSLWRRDMMHLLRERSRWIGVIVQPLIFWALIGVGMGGALARFGGEGDYLAYFFPGIVAMIVLFTAVFATMSVIEDRQRGFLQQVMVLPSSRAAIVLGKTAGVTTMAVVQVSLTMAVAPLAGVDLLGVHWPMFFAALILGCAGLTSLNFSLAWVVNSTAGYHGVMAVVMLPLWVLSGAMFPAGEGWMGWAMRLNPMAYLVDGLRHAMAGGFSPDANSGAGFGLTVLAGTAAVFTALAVRTVARSTQNARV